jgi:superfamily II DNA or RNA helicase
MLYLIEMPLYIYIIDNTDWNKEEKYKFGFTKNPINRILNSSEQHSYNSKYTKIYKVQETADYLVAYKEYDKIVSIIGRNDGIIDNIEEYYGKTFTYLRNIKKHLVNDGGSTEFIYKSGLEILHNLLVSEFQHLGLCVSVIDISEVQKINKKVLKALKNKAVTNTINPFNHKKVEVIIECEEYIPEPDKEIQYVIANTLRPYQLDIISGCVVCINKTNKVYLELATGGGKSFIVYNVFNIIKPKMIIIFAPLEIIKYQNISKKYTDILNTKYNILKDVPIGLVKDIVPNTIIVSCTQSYKKVYDLIIANKLKDVCIWFDEAHWAFEEWASYITDDIKQFLLTDSTHISKRIYTSASPDKEHLLKNKDIFGTIYNPVKAQELIRDRWLCPIKPYVFSVNKNDPDIIYYNLEGFKEKNKGFGFSFHSNCNNAFSLFMKHYKLYKASKTDIRPFLLLGDNFKTTADIDIALEYNYKDVKVFESSPNSIGYVVKRFSIGYDFNKIDIIFISDPKTSYKDIIQTIGRGMRPDKLGADGANLSKILDVYIPVYIDEDCNNEYTDIIEVLRYLIYDIGLEFKDINFNYKNKDKNDDSDNEINGDKYVGNEEVKGVLLDLLKNCNKKLWNCLKLTEHLLMKKIHNSKDYNDYRKNNPDLEIPENIFIEYPDFIWYDTYKDNECPYYTKKECIDVVKKLDNDDLYSYDDDEKLIYFNKIDNKIPNECLWGFYGGYRHSYFT